MNAPVIVAIETSSRNGSVALARGPELLAETEFPTHREHARELLPTLDSLCRGQSVDPNDLEQCHLSIGPGSFTGLRVAVTFARHLALATGVKIVAAPTLDVIVENCAAMDSPPCRVAVLLDAKRGQVFAAVYQLDPPVCRPPSGATSTPRADTAAAFAYRRIVEPCLSEPARLLGSLAKPLAVVGEGIDYHRAAVEGIGAEVLDRSLWPPKARNVYRVGWRRALEGGFTPPRDLVPFYLRRPEAEELWEKRHGPRP